MKYYLLLLLKTIVSCIILITILSCEGDYLEVPTSEGTNSHSFKVNGDKWVRSYTFFNPGKQLYSSNNQLNGFFDSEIEGDARYPLGIVIFHIVSLKEVPGIYELADYTDDFYYYGGSAGEGIDSSKCYVRFYYKTEEKDRGMTYKNIIDGKLEITRQDSVFSGIFDMVFTSETDTLTISEGKFDYLNNN